MEKRTDSDIDTLADLLDTKFKGPFGWRFGLDGLLGLIPGAGDLLTNIFSGYIIAQAVIQGYPLSVIARMGLNLLFENLVDAIPLLGNIFDFFWKANSKNVELMRRYQQDPTKVKRRSAFLTSVILTGVLLFVLGVTAVSVMVLVRFFEWLF